MSFNNPTAVKIGLTGTFSGVTYRVLGRVVMGVVDDGTAYYWNEFNLKADSGESATLVYEVMERGGEWRWFTLFDPQFPITAADAATKRVGDPLNLDGTDVRVTLLDNSRVYHIEGEAPEGIVVGAAAQYFNAESGNNMIVVSWTGEEVDCYHGVTIGSMLVAKAFNIPPAGLSEFTLSGRNVPSSSFWPAAIFGVLGLVIFFSIFGSVALPSRPPVKTQKFAAPLADLKVGSSGKIDGINYTVLSDAVVEVHEVNTNIQRHEFQLRDEFGNEALLVHGWKPGAPDWCLFAAVDPSEPLTPQKAAAVQCGKIVMADGAAASVNTLFNSVALTVDSQDASQNTTGKVLYGFSAASQNMFLLARWDETNLTFQKGHLVQEDLAKAFIQPAAK